MITNNTDKKALVKKLFADKVITLDQMYILLTEPDEQPAMGISGYPVYPYYPNGWWGIYPPAPTSPYVWTGGTITINAGDITGVSTLGTCVTDTTYIPTGTAMSYTAN